MKAHFTNVLRGQSDCSNNGISAQTDHVLLIVPEGGSTQFDGSDKPALWLGYWMGRTIAVPFEPEGFNHGDLALESLNGWMFSGNFLYSSDSRFSEIAESPIPVYDRQESAFTQKAFPAYNLVAFRNAAKLLDELYHQMATDSDLESVTAAKKYETFLDRMRIALFDLKSPQISVEAAARAIGR